MHVHLSSLNGYQVASTWAVVNSAAVYKCLIKTLLSILLAICLEDLLLLEHMII
jgi:hypothetical protein